MRLKTTAYLEKTRIPITIDVGFGDALGNPDYRLDYGSLLDFPPASVRAYSPETVIAEKFQAIVALGIINGRMKDYYDLWALPKAVDLNLDSLQASIEKTFERRQTDVPKERPPGLSQEFAADATKSAQWRAYSEATEIEGMSLADVVNDIWATLEPICAGVGRTT
jgi:predicted nucleotidyltransferase component of viral defense system